ncbi:MAG: hypothetical protein M1828_001156 [Chrysothrix sp. TS-e1954]|nr:MAG: hypothetical protein M1828_001156 [Chrysothrix sp. TS-e1954]
MTSKNIFQPIESHPPQQFTTRSNHPVARIGVNQTAPVQTNKFFANFFLGTQSQASWTHPYSVGWAKGGGITKSWGLAVSHIERGQLAYGPGSPSQYFINPIGIQSLILSANELGNSTVLTTDSLRAFSVNVNLAPQPSHTPLVTFPLVQGMGYVTAIYNSGTPLIQSSVGFKSLTYGGVVGNGPSVRYEALLQDDRVWLIYLTAAPGSHPPTLTLSSGTNVVGSTPFSGSVQIAKNLNGASAQAVYDSTCGVYPLRGSVSATVSGAMGQYQLSWTKGGLINKSLLMFALPHHVQAMSTSYSSQSRSVLQLDTTTKGVAQAIIGDSWTMSEHDLPYDMAFAPWTPTLRSQTRLPQAAVSLINTVGASELSEDFDAQTNLNSMYFAGKGLAKFATIVYTVHTLGKDVGTASAGLAKLKAAFSVFANNTQIYPLVYDSAWGGLVSSCSYTTGDPNCDFGNTYYNDHHFHYGYFVYTAAVIASLDPTWLESQCDDSGTIVKTFVNTLVRDYANPVSSDPYFPFSRMFDWYHGHSWAHGLYESADGKDEESSSEDAFSSYALKMWGKAIGDPNMEARGNLMLAIQARSFQNYYLLEQSNAIQPAPFVGNKAVGILFENKADHTTYFGTDPSFIEGIHMLPLNPASTLVRTPTFVNQEWNQYFNNGRADKAPGGWRGILYANLAITDPKTAYKFFSQQSWDNGWLDGGASRTWGLAWSAGLGGAT